MFGSSMSNKLPIFLAGTALGTVLGMLLASFGGKDLIRIAFMDARSLVYRLLGREEGVRFDVLLQ